jgi:hypothetical protein
LKLLLPGTKESGLPPRRKLLLDWKCKNSLNEIDHWSFDVSIII